jgi:hypothetical protein
MFLVKTTILSMVLIALLAFEARTTIPETVKADDDD